MSEKTQGPRASDVRRCAHCRQVVTAGTTLQVHGLPRSVGTPVTFFVCLPCQAQFTTILTAWLRRAGRRYVQTRWAPPSSRVGYRRQDRRAGGDRSAPRAAPYCPVSTRPSPSDGSGGPPLNNHPMVRAADAGRPAVERPSGGHACRPVSTHRPWIECHASSATVYGSARKRGSRAAYSERSNKTIEKTPVVQRLPTD